MWRMFFMKSISRQLFNTIADAIHKAVPAVSQRRAMPRFRLLGQQLVPYHYLQPLLVPIKKERRG